MTGRGTYRLLRVFEDYKRNKWYLFAIPNNPMSQYQCSAEWFWKGRDPRSLWFQEDLWP